MQGLKLSELKEGYVYQCLLSGKRVLVVDNIEKTYVHPFTKVESKQRELEAITYSSSDECCYTYTVYDYQLAETKEDEVKKNRISDLPKYQLPNTKDVLLFSNEVPERNNPPGTWDNSKG